jgi:hypothetical protein
MKNFSPYSKPYKPTAPPKTQLVHITTQKDRVFNECSAKIPYGVKTVKIDIHPGDDYVSDTADLDWGYEEEQPNPNYEKQHAKYLEDLEKYNQEIKEWEKKKEVWDKEQIEKELKHKRNLFKRLKKELGEE